MSSKSDECYEGRHEDCDGCNLNSHLGCECECHYEDKPPERSE